MVKTVEMEGDGFEFGLFLPAFVSLRHRFDSPESVDCPDILYTWDEVKVSFGVTGVVGWWCRPSKGSTVSVTPTKLPRTRPQPRCPPR